MGMEAVKTTFMFESYTLSNLHLPP